MSDEEKYAPLTTEQIDAIKQLMEDEFDDLAEGLSQSIDDREEEIKDLRSEFEDVDFRDLQRDVERLQEFKEEYEGEIVLRSEVNLQMIWSLVVTWIKAKLKRKPRQSRTA